MAAIYLEPLDRRMKATGLTYARFMDDWVILAPTRWSLRRAAVIVNEMLRELRVEQHPDKTFVGWIRRGFTFLGYWITEKGVTGVAPATWIAFQERVARLYEQNAPPEKVRRSVELYVRRWRRWVVSGVRLPKASPDEFGRCCCRCFRNYHGWRSHQTIFIGTTRGAFGSVRWRVL